MSEIDKLLAQVKAEYQKKKEQPQQQSQVTPPSQPNHPDRELSPLDKLLAEVKGQFDSEKKGGKGEILIPLDRQEKASVAENQIADVKAQFKQKQAQQPQNSAKSQLVANLQELQAEYQQKQRVDLEQNRQQHLKDIQVEEELRQRRQQALVRQAQEWLKKLDPHSDEGFWFEQFAHSYNSKLEAAIDYLEALGVTPSNEVNF